MCSVSPAPRPKAGSLSVRAAVERFGHGVESPASGYGAVEVVGLV